MILRSAMKPAPPKNAAALKRETMREQLWPGSSAEIYNHRQTDGFVTIPRTLSLILGLIEELAVKGKNTTRVYVDLWCRTWPEQFIEVSDEDTWAFASGLTVKSWRQRIDVLKELGFIDVKPNGKRQYGYIVLLDPHKVVKKLHTAGKIKDHWYGAYVKRASEIKMPLP
jgi:hypothetical protein